MSFDKSSTIECKKKQQSTTQYRVYIGGSTGSKNTDMFDDEDGMEQIGEFDRKSGFYFSNITHIILLILAQAVLNGDVDPLEVQDEDVEDDTTEEPADDEGGIRDEL